MYTEDIQIARGFLVVLWLFQYATEVRESTAKRKDSPTLSSSRRRMGDSKRARGLWR